MQSPLSCLTASEYLSIEQHSEIRHEYVDGEIFAMAGASEEHNLIAGNIYNLLRSHLRGTSCRTFMSDMKLKINIAQADIFYYPDIVVTCDPQDKEKYFKTRPSLIVEVLSDSTKVIDKREKRSNYRTLDSLQEYVLVYQDEMKVEIYRKNDDGDWIMQTLGKGDLLELNSVGLRLSLNDIYEDVLIE